MSEELVAELFSDGETRMNGAISALEAGPEFQALTQAGEEAILQSAAATGGLRGGQTQAALAQFRPQVLSSLINQQYSRLGGLTALGQTTTQNVAQLGQAAAAGQAAAGQQTAANISNLFGQQGAAQAGAALAQGQAPGFGDTLLAKSDEQRRHQVGQHDHLHQTDLNTGDGLQYGGGGSLGLHGSGGDGRPWIRPNLETTPAMDFLLSAASTW